MSHAAGCPVITLAHIFAYVADSEWKVVILQLFIGTWIALLGKRYFPNMAGVIYGVVSSLYSLNLMLMYGTNNSLIDVWAAIVYAILIGIIVGKLARWNEFWAILFMGAGIWFAVG